MPKMNQKIFACAKTEPFRVEDYRGAKLEFYYLEDTPYATKFLSQQRFYVWTSDGIDYRLFIEKGYYERLTDLYQNRINEISLDFTNFVYDAQKKINRKYTITSLACIIPGLGIAIGLTYIPAVKEWAFLIAMVILFVILFLTSNHHKNQLGTLVRAENQKASQEIKNFLGEAKFEALLDEQQKYYAEYFKFEDDEDIKADENDDQDLIDAPEENNEEAEKSNE